MHLVFTIFMFSLHKLCKKETDGVSGHVQHPRHTSPRLLLLLLRRAALSSTGLCRSRSAAGDLPGPSAAVATGNVAGFAECRGGGVSGELQGPESLHLLQLLTRETVTGKTRVAQEWRLRKRRTTNAQVLVV